MHVAALHLVNFRNYRRLDLELPAAAVVVVGDNGQGKTNLLDAVHTLATGRSLRPAPESAWVHVDAPEAAAFARIAASVERCGGVLDLELIAARTDPSAGAASGVRRRVRIGGAARRLVELPGRLQTVSFSSADLTLLTGPPSDRRRWLDVALVQLERAYLDALAEFDALLARRNALLRQIQAQRARSAELDFWDERIAQPAAQVVRRRRAFVLELVPLVAHEFDRLSGGARLGVAYQASAPAHEPEEFRAILASRRQRDIESGSTGAGPQRDDLRATLDGRPIAHFGSRGQIRLAALALKLGQFALAHGRLGETPVLLLDDIAAELDPGHRRRLLDRIPSDTQAIVTTADPEAIADGALASAPWLCVSDGLVEPTNAPA